MERMMQRLVDRLVRAGMPLFGARWLEVPGRRSGQMRGVVVNPLDHDGRTYLYAPRGTTHWVRNLRAAGTGTLGGRPFSSVELDGGSRPDIQAAYLRRWGWQVRSLVGPDPDPAEHPVFEVTYS